MSARDFPAKLALAAEALGCRTQKELMAQIMAVNPRTSFDPVRSYKWLQGRSTPRDPSVYQDLSDALGLARSGESLRACSLEAFRAMLAERAGPAPAAAESDQPNLSYLDGVYVLYMRSFSQFPRPKIFYCRLLIATGPGRLTTAQIDLPLAGQISRYQGTVDCYGRLVSTVLASETRGTTALLWFADPAAPVRAIGALVGGQVAFIAAAVPKCTRAALIRVPVGDVDLAATDCYCEVDEADVTRTLAAIGYPAAEASGAGRQLLQFLSPSGDETAVSVPVEDAERLMAAIERAHRMAESPAA